MLRHGDERKGCLCVLQRPREPLRSPQRCERGLEMNLYRQETRNNAGGNLGPIYAVANTAASARALMRAHKPKYMILTGRCEIQIKNILVESAAGSDAGKG